LEQDFKQTYETKLKQIHGELESKNGEIMAFKRLVSMKDLELQKKDEDINILKDTSTEPQEHEHQGLISALQNQIKHLEEVVNKKQDSLKTQAEDTTRAQTRAKSLENKLLEK